MPSPDPTREPQSAAAAEALAAFGRYAGPATLILSSLAGGTKHGYALAKDIEAFAGLRIAPGTLYEALGRLERRALIEAVEKCRPPPSLPSGRGGRRRVALATQRAAPGRRGRARSAWGPRPSVCRSGAAVRPGVRVSRAAQTPSERAARLLAWYPAAWRER